MPRNKKSPPVVKIGKPSDANIDDAVNRLTRAYNLAQSEVDLASIGTPIHRRLSAIRDKSLLDLQRAREARDQIAQLSVDGSVRYQTALQAASEYLRRQREMILLAQRFGLLVACAALATLLSGCGSTVCAEGHGSKVCISFPAATNAASEVR